MVKRWLARRGSDHARLSAYASTALLRSSAGSHWNWLASGSVRPRIGERYARLDERNAPLRSGLTWSAEAARRRSRRAALLLVVLIVGYFAAAGLVLWVLVARVTAHRPRPLTRRFAISRTLSLS